MSADQVRKINSEVEMIDRLSRVAEADINTARKRSHGDYHLKSRKRGRDEK